jgi:hypothetical protein
MNSISDSLLCPRRVWSRAEVLSTSCPVPKTPGVYAWYFQHFPIEVPTQGCIRYNSLTLLYIGISPKAPPSNGRLPSTQTLADRIKYHYRGNAAGSTLRLTLGCLLSKQLDIQLRRVGSGKRMTFSEGEQTLSDWMAQNAFVVWMVHPEPWEVEEALIQQLSLPLNLDQNRHHVFHQVLSAKRREAKAQARALPILAK